jgi:hypothetical protein
MEMVLRETDVQRHINTPAAPFETKAENRFVLGLFVIIVLCLNFLDAQCVTAANRALGIIDDD